MNNLILVRYLLFSLYLQISCVSGDQISVHGASTTQVGTWNNHFSSLAIDGDVNTYSVACVRCDANNPTDTIGWWKIDFDRPVDIAGVLLTSSHNYPDKDYLQEIIVGVANHTSYNMNDYIECGKLDNRNVPIPSNMKIGIACPHKIRGRSVIVKRKAGAHTRPDSIAIAEIRFYSEKGDWMSTDGRYGGSPDRYQNKSVQCNGRNDPNCRGNWTDRPSNVRAFPNGRSTPIKSVTQSATYDLNYAWQAIDGKNDTYSIAVSNQYWQHAWWQAELGQTFSVTGLTIVSSHDYTNAQYLKTFKVLVSEHDYIHDPTFNQTQLCVTVTDQGVIPTKTLIAFRCLETIQGRYVIIKSTTGPISLAEVIIYVSTDQ